MGGVYGTVGTDGIDGTDGISTRCAATFPAMLKRITNATARTPNIFRPPQQLLANNQKIASHKHHHAAAMPLTAQPLSGTATAEASHDRTFKEDWLNAQKSHFLALCAPLRQ